MSKNGKIALIIAGVLASVLVVCAGGFAFFAYFIVDKEEIERAGHEGEEYGRTTDNAGCVTKVIPMIKQTSDIQISESTKIKFYFGGCLKTSRPTPNYCDGAVGPYADIFNNDKGKDAECEKLGLKGSLSCRHVIEEKLDFCAKKSK